MKNMILTPSHDGKLHSYYVDSLINSLRAVPETAHLFVIGDAMVFRARNELLQHALNTDVEQVVWIDSDEAWKPEDFKKIIEDERDFVTGMVFQKTDKPVVCLRKPDEKTHTVESCGMGFCKMRRNVMEHLWKAGKPYVNGDQKGRMVFEPYVERFTKELVGEDVGACKKWNGPIYYDDTIRVFHIGERLY